MKRFFLLVFVTVFEPMTRIGSPTNRANPIVVLLVICGIGYGIYYYVENHMPDFKLMSAAEEGNNKDVESAIGLGANLAYRDRIGRTALHLAARYENADTVKMLLERGAYVNARDSRGRTALHMTRFDKADNIKTMKVLLEKGANPNIKNNKGETVLYIVKHAVVFSKKKRDLLLKHGAK